MARKGKKLPPRTALHCKRLSDSLFGKKKSDVEIEKNRISHVGLRQSKETIEKRVSKLRGRKLSEEHRGKLCYPKSEEHKRKDKEWHVNHPNRKFSNTSIEVKTGEELDRRNIKYLQNYGLDNIANVDFFLPDYKIIIQCDGDYWHNLPKVIEKDNRQNGLLKESGYKIYRFWEHEINEDIKKCIDKIKKVCQT